MSTIEHNLPLKSKNSFGVEVEARHWATFATAEELPALFEQIPAGMPWMVIGGGNNILFTQDYEGILLHPIGEQIQHLGSDATQAYVRADAGVEWDRLVEWTVSRGWGGMENLSWIPGSVGAAPVQNIGAYGTEACCVITAVECYVPAEHRMMRLSAEACCFGYRDSIFKRELQGRVVITAVEFTLSLKPLFHVRYGELSREVEQLGGMSLEHIRQAVIAIRKHKLPDPKQLGNAGSFFKNPVVSRAVADALTERFPDMPRYEVSNEEVKLAAGWLIDQSGWRGRREGKVGVHESQALVLVNYGGATGAEVMALAHRIQEAVATQFGVQIEMEVNLR